MSKEKCKCTCHIIKRDKLFPEKAVREHNCCEYSYGKG